jgi:cytoplasmic iron level regulating protein YaaA (DUF328/UPF0246 family)
MCHNTFSYVQITIMITKLLSSIGLVYNSFENNDLDDSNILWLEHSTQIVSSCYNIARMLDIKFTLYRIVVSIMK